MCDDNVDYNHIPEKEDMQFYLKYKNVHMDTTISIMELE
jgi:hypothetical protein